MCVNVAQTDCVDYMDYLVCVAVGVNTALMLVVYVAYRTHLVCVDSVVQMTDLVGVGYKAQLLPVAYGLYIAYLIVMVHLAYCADLVCVDSVIQMTDLVGVGYKAQLLRVAYGVYIPYLVVMVHLAYRTDLVWTLWFR